MWRPAFLIPNIVLSSLISRASLVAQLVKESAFNVEDLGSVPGLGRFPGEGKGYPLQDSGLENSMDCMVHGVAKSWAQLSGFHFHIQYDWCSHMKDGQMRT